MVLVAYKIFMDGLARLMEDSAVSYQLYASLTFSTTSLLSTGRAIKGVMYMKGWRGKVFLAWFATSSIYVLGFPTLISATAGYVKPSTAGFKMADSTFLTPASSALRSCYVVHDGALIGLQNGTVVQGPPVSQLDFVSGMEIDHVGSISDIDIPRFQQDYPVFASLLNATVNVQQPVFQYNGSDTSQSNDGLGHDSLDEDFTSNITIVGHVYKFNNWVFGLGDAFSQSYCYDNQTVYDLPSMAECLPETYYVWGLSSLLLYIVLCLQISWIFGMYFVWLDANIYSAICRSGRRMRGDFRAAVDLSDAMGEVLGNETCAYSNDEMRSALNREPGLRYYAADVNGHDVAHIGISSMRIGKVPYNSTALYGRRCKYR